MTAIFRYLGNNLRNGYGNGQNRERDCHHPLLTFAGIAELASAFSHFSHKPAPSPHKTTQLDPNEAMLSY